MNNETHRIINKIAKIFAFILIISIISGVINAVVNIGQSFFDKPTKIGDTIEVSGEYPVEGIDTLYIDLKAAKLNITNGDKLTYETNDKYVQCSQNNNKITFIEKSHTTDNSSNYYVNIMIPEDLKFKDVEIDTGAGEINIGKLSAEDLDMELGAGSTEINSLLTTSETDIETGAGELIVKSGSMNNLDLNMGMGNVEISGVLTGQSNFNCGLGAVSLDIFGASNDYTFYVNKGIGDIRIAGKSYRDNETVGNGINKVNLNGGVGEITVDFSIA